MEYSRKRICIDFDGVLAMQLSFPQIGNPAKGGLQALRKLHGQGYELVVFTSREDLEPVREWLVKHAMAEFITFVTNKKLPAIAYIDDRAIRFTNWWDVGKYFL